MKTRTETTSHPCSLIQAQEQQKAEDFALRMTQYRAKIARQLGTGEATQADYDQARRVEDRAHRAAEAHNRGRYNQ